MRNRYEDRYEDHYWDTRIERALRSRGGFAWGTFFLGLIVGGILF